MGTRCPHFCVPANARPITAPARWFAYFCITILLVFRGVNAYIHFIYPVIGCPISNIPKWQRQ
ncbi:hypothetical protein HMPREF0742_01060 [Rothia aeria F0184]|uniref:Uncharacterized protein n=1 Tax=Rothia aeria F0184 TaxID=888019 RepID=U7V3X3_9MICC|nr:hypothetical protein HMPREF0742_01060 [Rothia aeria F0184]